MRKILIAASLICSLAACNNEKKISSTGTTDSAQVSGASATVENAPVISFAESTYDFGKIKTGEKVSYEYKFTNTGKSPLIISDAQATCGCTVPEYPKEPIAPGQEGTIKVVFDSSGKSGKQNKVVTLTSNANPTSTQLFLVGEVSEK